MMMIDFLSFPLGSAISVLSPCLLRTYLSGCFLEVKSQSFQLVYENLSANISLRLHYLPENNKKGTPCSSSALLVHFAIARRLKIEIGLASWLESLKVGLLDLIKLETADPRVLAFGPRSALTEAPMPC